MVYKYMQSCNIRRICTNKLCALTVAFITVGCSSTQVAPQIENSHSNNLSIDPLQYVNPFIGTDGKGKTYPGATVPYGAVQLSPDNGRGGWDWIAGYFWPDNIIAGFSHTHLSGTGAGDLYDISFMPLSPVKGEYIPRREVTEGGPKQGTIVSSFSHQNEQASPGYYSVFLDDYKIKVELSAATHGGIQRYTFDKNTQEAAVRLDLGYSRNWDKTVETHIEVINPRSIAGYRYSTGWAKDQRVYFYTEFSQPIRRYELDVDGKTSSAQQITANNIAAQFHFSLQNTSQLEVRTALSSVSAEKAQRNFEADQLNDTFETLLQNAENAWRKELSKVEVKASPDNLTQFYTALYHAALAPRVFSDADGQYKGPDGDIHQSTGKKRYEFFSLWDTFRALHPWKTIIAPTQSRDMMTSIMDHYTVAGRLPVWIFQGNETDMMMGYHAVPVLVDAYMKGLTNESGEAILNAALHSAQQQNFGIGAYQELGYVPYEDRPWNVSLTLEYAYDDAAIARLAKALGKHRIAQNFQARAKNYRHHYDAQSGFMRAKNRNGEFRPSFSPFEYRSPQHHEDYCEANAWQYTFFVPHDIEGMVQMMGGKAATAAKLDQMFSAQQQSDELPEWISGYIGQYVHGNEPSHHVPYLYQYLEQPAKTQALVRQIMHELYTTQADGLAGNEDAGQMSAWYLFSALGFYPVDPASGQYVLGSPEVEQATLYLENGNTFTVEALNQSEKNIYVKSVSLNGQPLQRFYITHDEILKGGKLQFTMSREQP